MNFVSNDIFIQCGVCVKLLERKKPPVACVTTTYLRLTNETLRAFSGTVCGCAHCEAPRNR